MMDPVIEPFAQVLSEISFPSQLPVISVTATLTAEQACDPMYWARHLRETVRFSAAISSSQESRCVLIEVGPGQTLSTWLTATWSEEGQVVLAVSPHAKQMIPVRQLVSLR